MNLRTAPLATLLVLSCMKLACGGAEAADDAAADAALGGGAATGGRSSVGTGGSGGSPPVTDPCAPRPGSLVPEIVSIEVRSKEGSAPAKGDRLLFGVTLRNAGTGVGPVTVTPRIDSGRFSDYTAVPVGSAEVTLCAQDTTVTIEAGPFLDDEEREKHYALGAGDYTISSVDVAVEGNVTSFEELGGAAFSVAESNALLVPVVYDGAYFDVVAGLTTTSPEEYLRQAFSRSTQLFTPQSNDDPDGAGSFQTYTGGFDEMMDVRHLFRAFPGFPGETTTDEGWCEDATFYAQSVLGMESAWVSAPQGTRPERHGFDYLLAISPGLGGGVACGWIDVQVTGLIGTDLNRQQIVTVHETAHLFGAPHCDDVGNGSGGPLQGYVMCSGEKHANYPEHFVFHSSSRGQMSSRWN